VNGWRFPDRRSAGRSLATRLGAYAGRSEVVVLGLPRGGVPVAFEVASALDAPLDVFVVRKLGVPFQSELAMGAIASGGVRVLNNDVVAMAGITPEMVARAVSTQEHELARRERLYRNGRPPLALTGKIVILVDDGLATGSTMRAAVEAVRRLQPARVVVAIPVAAAERCRSLATVVDDVICLRTPVPFSAVGLWYEDFSQTTDDQVRTLLEQASSVWRRRHLQYGDERSARRDT
jgi:putative phosphoribosyl transferase